MIFDFGQLKNSISCSCIFRKSITSHTKLCNSVRHFYYGLGRAATAMGAQMSKIFGHETGDTVDFLKKIASILPHAFLVGSCVYFRGPINYMHTALIRDLFSYGFLRKLRARTLRLI